MKKYFFLFVFLAACAASRTYVRIPRNGLYGYFQPAPGKAHISAHRGGGDIPGYPENCIESFDFLARQMPVTIECDISLTRDSVLVMMHDNTLERTTTGQGALKDVTWAYCQTLFLEDNLGNRTTYRIPTLEQVLRWGKGKVTFTLDVKRNVPFEKVVELIRKTGTKDYAAVITYNADDAAKVHRLDPELMISVNVRSQADYDRLRALGIPDQRMLAFIGVREADRDLYAFLHSKGIPCILGTLGNLDKQAQARGDQVYKTFVGTERTSSRPTARWKPFGPPAHDEAPVIEEVCRDRFFSPHTYHRPASSRWAWT